MESLAFNIMARIDDLLYVDDATKQRASLDSMCLYDPRRFGPGPGPLPKQKQISARPFSVQQASCASPIKPPFHPRNPMRGSSGKRTHLSIEKSNSTSDAEDD